MRPRRSATTLVTPASPLVFDGVGHLHYADPAVTNPRWPAIRRRGAAARDSARRMADQRHPCHHPASPAPGPEVVHDLYAIKLSLSQSDPHGAWVECLVDRQRPAARLSRAEHWSVPASALLGLVAGAEPPDLASDLTVIPGGTAAHAPSIPHPPASGRAHYHARRHGSLRTSSCSASDQRENGMFLERSDPPGQIDMNRLPGSFITSAIVARRSDPDIS